MQRSALLVVVFLSLAALNFFPAVCRSQPDGPGGEAPGLETDAAVAEPSPAPVSAGTSSKIGIAVKISTLGAGIEVGTPLGRKFNVRGGFNFISFGHTFREDGIPYAGNLKWRSGEANLDWFPFGPFHLTPGLLFYDGNKVTATASVPTGNTFTLSGTSYESGAVSPVTGGGSMGFSKVAPTFRMGVGNLIPRSGRHWSFLAEIGFAYQASPKAILNFSGTVCQPPNTSGPTCVDAATNATVQSNVQGEQTKINNDVKYFKFFPLLSLGVGFNF